MSAASALSLSGVTVRVRDGQEQLTILDGASLQVDPGEFVAVTGRSGSGKSTLLAVAGLLRTPYSGEVVVGGVPSSGLRSRERAKVRRDHVAFVYQSSQLFPSLRAVEQLELVAHIRGQLDSRARARARELLGEVGLADRTDHLPAQLSGGERQRVAIGRALMAEPSVILADEPTAALDPERSRQIMELLAEETRRREVATVVVIHDPTSLDLADRHLELRDGALHPPAEAHT